MRTLLLSALVLVVYLLHQDFWYWRVAQPFVFGFLPIGLFYHAAFTLASAGLLLVLVKYGWPGHLERESGSE